MDTRTSNLQFGQGSPLWKFWTKGEGAAKWKGSKNKWTTLNNLLKAVGVPADEVDGLTTNIIQAVLPGYMDSKQKKGKFAQPEK